MTAADSSHRYRRSRLLLLLWAQDGLVLLQAETQQRFAIKPRLLQVLSALDSWTPASEMERGGIDNGAIARFHELRLLERDDDEEAGQPAWDPLELAVHRHTATGGAWPAAERRNAKTEKLVLAGSITDLPAPAAQLSMPIGEVLQQRRSRRTYGERALGLREVSTLLHHSARLRPGGHRHGAADISYGRRTWRTRTVSGSRARVGSRCGRLRV